MKTRKSTLRKSLALVGAGAVVMVGAVTSAVTVSAHSGTVTASENCSSWTAAVYLEDNVTSDRTVDVSTTIPGTTGITNGHWTTTGDSSPVEIWSGSGGAPATGTVTLDIWNGSSLEFSATASIAPATGCSAPTITTTLSSGSIALGSAAHDSATLHGQTSKAGGTVTYEVYTEDTNGTCSSPATTQINAQPGSVTVSNGSVPNSPAVTFNQVGTYYWQASYSGDASNKPAVSACGAEVLTVQKRSPSITTTLSSSWISVGSSIHDTATLSGATSNAGGTVTYQVYTKDTNNTCSGLATTQINAQPGSVTVTGGVVPNSPAVVFNQVGTYYWQATYSGDANNSGATSSCKEETVTVTKASPSIATTLSSASLAVGSSIHDTAALSGATSGAGGTVTYQVYTSDSNNACSGLATTQINAQPGSVTVTGGVVPNSPAVTFNQVGTYYWQATYSGDANNGGAVSSCNEETVTVTKTSPSITTTLSSASIVVGSSVADTAALSGVTSSAGGTVTYQVYTSDSNNTCSGLATTQINAQPGSVTVTGGIVPDSPAVTFNQVGTYYWQATYSGDASNGAAVSSCSEETLTVNKQAPSVGTQTVPASPVAIGAPIHDTAVLTGATADAGGTIAYAVYSGPSCSAGSLVADLTPAPNTIVDGVVPNSAIYAFTAAGTWYFQATYSGDTNNAGPVSSPCTSEAVTVDANAPTIATLAVPASPVAIGTAIHDTATLTGATADAGGTIGYSLYSTAWCGGLIANLTPADDTVVDGAVPDSAPYTVTTAGTFYFAATYSGDANNAGPISSPCDSEAVTVEANIPALGTQTVPASPLTIGEPVRDTATLTGATSDAGGTIGYGVYSSDTCGAGSLMADLTPADDTVVDGVVPDSNSYAFDAAGTFYFQATYSGDNNNAGPISSPCLSEATVVDGNTPSIGTHTVPGSPVAIGEPVYDTATLTGATSDAGGTVAYGVYSSDACGAGTLVANLTPADNTVVGGVVPDSNSYAFTSAGTWYFQATYSGDANNAGPISSPCTSEAMVVDANRPSIGTQTVPASPVTIGQPVYDTATLTGATSDAGGTVTYGLYNDSSCDAGSLVSDLTPLDNTVNDGVVPDSNPHTFTAAGTWYFQATYSGDGNNAGPVSSPCLSEALVVTPNRPSIGTQTVPVSPLTIGEEVHDTATLTGATVDAGGSVTYGVYSDSSCGSLVMDLTPADNTVVDGVVPDSSNYAFTGAGTWYFEATYSGDANNLGPVSSPCTSETTVVTPNVPSIGTQTVPGSPVAVGTAVHDTSLLSGETANAGGTVTYSLYSDSLCTSLVSDLTPTDNTVVNGVVPNSNPYTFTTPGTWYFEVSYSGDANNRPALSGCVNEAMVVHTVTSSSPTPTGGVKGITTPGTGAGPSPLTGFVWTLGTILILLGGAFLVGRRRISTDHIEDV
ncbi:MAG: hypothetical protein ABSA40_09135 [Candidatus Dormibacteria bacterium]